MGYRWLSSVSVLDSWLDSSVTEVTIDKPGKYSLDRNDRLTRKGGGMLFLIYKNWPSYTVPIPEKFKTLEIIIMLLQSLGFALHLVQGTRSRGYQLVKKVKVGFWRAMA